MSHVLQVMDSYAVQSGNITDVYTFSGPRYGASPPATATDPNMSSFVVVGTFNKMDGSFAAVLPVLATPSARVFDRPTTVEPPKTGFVPEEVFVKRGPAVAVGSQKGLKESM